MGENKPKDVECPDCGGPMVVRTNRQSGEKFWGCKRFPECRGTRDNMGRSREERNQEREQEKQDNESDKYRFRRG